MNQKKFPEEAKDQQLKQILDVRLLHLKNHTVPFILSPMISFENMFISTTLTELRKIPAKVSTLNISLHQQHFLLDESNKVKQKHSSVSRISVLSLSYPTSSSFR